MLRAVFISVVVLAAVMAWQWAMVSESTAGPPDDAALIHLFLGEVAGDSSEEPPAFDIPDRAEAEWADCVSVPRSAFTSVGSESFRVSVSFRAPVDSQPADALLMINSGEYPGQLVRAPDGTYRFDMTFVSPLDAVQFDRVSLCVRWRKTTNGLALIGLAPSGALTLNAPTEVGPFFVNWTNQFASVGSMLAYAVPGGTTLANPCFPGCLPQVVNLGGPVPGTPTSLSVAAFHFSDFDIGFIRIVPAVSGVNPLLNCHIAGDTGSITLTMPVFRGMPFYVGVSTATGSLGTPPDPSRDSCDLMSVGPFQGAPLPLQSGTVPRGIEVNGMMATGHVRLLNLAGLMTDYTGYSAEMTLVDNDGVPVARGETKLTGITAAPGRFADVEVPILGFDSKPLTPAQTDKIAEGVTESVRLFKRGN